VGGVRKIPFAKPIRLFIIVVAIILFVIIVIAAVSPKTAPTPKPTPTPQVTVIPTPATLSFTLKSGIGIDTVKVTNQKTGATITLTPADLPATFNFTSGDTLAFSVTAQEGYRFNAWVFGDGTFQSQNPYTIKASATFTMEARFLMEAQ